jgi:hypothetical protein
VKLDAGVHRLLVKVDLGSGPEYFEGSTFEIPRGVRGSMILRFGISAGMGGSSLSRISPAEFDR